MPFTPLVQLCGNHTQAGGQWVVSLDRNGGPQKFLSPGMKTRYLPSRPLPSPLAFYV